MTPHILTFIYIDSIRITQITQKIMPSESLEKDEIQVWLVLVQIFNAILRPLFSAAAQLPPSVGQTCSQPGFAGFPQKAFSEG